MNGVEILASNEVAIEYAFNWTTFWIIGSIVLGIFTIVGILLWTDDECEWGIIPALFITGVVIGVPLGFAAGSATSKPIEYTTEYKVIISDEVSMTEFNEKYEVVGQEGKIYTIKERD